jgi:fructose-1,6-bisphosphatase/inositol monophosphatase family enzyme
MTPAERAAATVVAPDLVERLHATAVAAARAAGEVQLREFRRSPTVREARAHDLTLETDLRCEREMVRVIREAFPGHGIMSEEGGDRPGGEPWLWVLDPLDGTVNFYHGIPFFCACVSCHRRPDAAAARFSDRLGTVAAAVFAPALGELASAVHGRGAALNGGALACDGGADLGSAVVGVSLGSRPGDADAMLRLCGAIGGRVRKLRSFGSTGYDLAQVGAGRLGGLVQRGVNLWDVAAGALVLEEAGGVVEGWAAPGGRWDLIAAVPGVHAPLSRLAHEAWAESV